MTPELHASKDALLDEMRDYQRFGGAEDENDPDFDPDFDAGYRPADIQRCGEVIDTLFEDLLQVPATEGREAAILAAVKDAVLALNALNEDCSGNLIETGEREALCDLIERAAREAGLPESDQDITEAWREW